MKKMFDLPFWMIFHKNKINLEEIPQIPDFEYKISKQYAVEYLDLFRELASAIYKNDEAQMKFLQPKISKLTSKLGKSVDKIGGNDMQKFADLITKLSNV